MATSKFKGLHFICPNETLIGSFCSCEQKKQTRSCLEGNLNFIFHKSKKIAIKFHERIEWRVIVSRDDSGARFPHSSLPPESRGAEIFCVKKSVRERALHLTDWRSGSFATRDTEKDTKVQKYTKDITKFDFIHYSTIFKAIGLIRKTIWSRFHLRAQNPMM